MAVNLFTGATDNNWGTATNWSLGAVPTASDGNVATLDATSPNCTLDTSARVCNHINFTGYTNTITFTQQLTVSGNVTLGASMIFAGSSQFRINATSTLTSNGKSIDIPFTVITATVTLADNATLNFLFSNAGGTLNGNTLFLNDGMTVSSASQGTTNFEYTGTGTVSGTVALKNNFRINTAGTLTFGSTFFYNTGIFKYDAGTVIITGNTITAALATTWTFNASGFAFNILTISGNHTFNGTNGCTIATLNSLTAGNTHTLQSTNTYTITTAMTVTGTSASHISFISSTGGSQAILTLQNNGATQDMSFVNATDIDSSLGQTIWSFKGTLSNATNWGSLVAPILTVGRIY